MAPASTLLAQSALAEGGELFPALLTHLRRLYPEVYGSAVATCQVPERREIHIGEGGGLRGGTSVHIIIKLGTYAGRFNNLSLAGMNNPIPNLTNVYLDTPLVAPTPDPLEYVPLPGRLEQPRGYTLTSTGAYIGGYRRRPSPPSPPYHTHPRMHSPTGRAQPRKVMQTATGHAKTLKIWPQGGNP